MNRLCSMLLACSMGISLLCPAVSHAAEQSAPDGYLVGIRDTAQEEAMSLLGASEGEEIREGLYLVDDLETVRRMERQGMVSYYEPNERMELLEGGEAYTPTQWSMNAIHAPAAWEHRDAEGNPDLQGTGVTVAVIDSGVYRDHPDFKQENILECCNLTGAPNGVDVWHGTFVAGVIAAQVNNALGTDGVAPDVKLLPICVTSGGGTNTSLVINAIDSAVAQGADVINLSLGGKTSKISLEKACEDAVNAGVLLVGAAGNYRVNEAKSENSFMYPASCDGVTSVSACRQDGDSVVFDHSYSYFNNKILVSAPGTAVQSLYPDGGTATKKGTSFAAPVVSAMAAMAKQRCPEISSEAFQRLLTESAVDLGTPGYDLYYGHGFVDVAAFVKALDQSYTVQLDLQAEDAAFAPETILPEAYTLGAAVTLPEPVRPGYRFMGWREAAESTAPLVKEIPAGSVGNKQYSAVWQDAATVRCFAQYDAAGRMLSLSQQDENVNSVAEVRAKILEDTARGSLFRLDQNGSPVWDAEWIEMKDLAAP